MSKPSVFIKLERRISADERGGVMHRWEYGRELLKAKAGRKQLPDGMIADLIAAAERVGEKISEREIQYRVRLATVYATDQQVRKAIADLGPWTEIIKAGFPEVTVDEDFVEPEDVDAVAHDGFEQLSLLPGFKPTIKVHGRELKIDEATVPDVIAYRDKYRAMHEGFGKTLDAIEATIEQIIDGWDGDPETKAVDAYQLGST